MDNANKTESKKQNNWIVKRPLQLSSPFINGEDVKELQRKLIEAGYACGKDGTSGIFGFGTQKAVRAFQGSNGLAINGKARKDEIRKLGGIYRA